MYAYVSTGFAETHGYLTLPINSTIVPASTQEHYGLSSGGIGVWDRQISRRGAAEALRFPQLLVFISIFGGWGVYTREDITEGDWLTEYDGHVIDQHEYNRMIVENQVTHIKTLSGMNKHLDDRLVVLWNMSVL